MPESESDSSTPAPPDAPPPPAAAPGGPDVAAAAPDPVPAPVEEGLERREFVRKATTDAVTLAGRFYSLSRILSRSVTAAGQSMVDNLETIRLEQTPAPAASGAASALGDGTTAVAAGGTATPDAASDGGSVPGEVAAALAPTGSAVESIGEPTAIATAVVAASPNEPVSTAPAAPPIPAAPPEPPRRTMPPLTDSQTALLATAMTAVLGVNRAGLGPHLTPAQFHWDGATFRIPSLGWAARIGNIRRESRVTVFVEDLETGDFGSIGGTATIAEGRHARGESDGLLARYHPGADPDERWAQLIAEDLDRVVIVVAADQAIWGRRG